MKYHSSSLVGAVLGSAALLSAPAASSVPQPSPIPVRVESRDVYSRAISRLDGTPVSTVGFPRTVDGFDQYLKASGVRTVTASELTTPNHPAVAARYGYSAFLPAKEWWPRGAALALLAERLANAAGSPVHIRNWWRPAEYNSDPAVKGAPNGDHPTASALDIDYATQSGRMRAERLLRELKRTAPWMNLSLGLGPLTTHVGLASPKGSREWHYAGWQPSSLTLQ